MTLPSPPTPGDGEGSATPDGWVLVPTEPTEAMIVATKDAFAEVNGIIAFCAARGSHPGGLKDKDCMKNAYRAMLAASPSPPSPNALPELNQDQADAQLSEMITEGAIGQLTAMGDAQAERIARLEEALRPFAARIVDIGETETDDDWFSNGRTPYCQSPTIKVGDVRRAADLLNPSGSRGGG